MLRDGLEVYKLGPPNIGRIRKTSIKKDLTSETNVKSFYHYIFNFNHFVTTLYIQ